MWALQDDSHLSRLSWSSLEQRKLWSALKHVGITDSDKEMLKMSAKTLSSWSAHALKNDPWYSVWPSGLTSLTHVGHGERNHTVVHDESMNAEDSLWLMQYRSQKCYL